MIGQWIDSLVGVFAPGSQLKRMAARAAIQRGFQGAEPNRLNAGNRPKNRPADMELLGPNGADALRAYARQLVRDNAYAWGAVDTIVSSVVGTGIKIQSNLETQDGEDVEGVNEGRDGLFERWAEVAELTGQYTLSEVQQICQREIVEAGECLVHFVTVPKYFRGIRRPVPFALELIEADRLASDRDTYAISRRSGVRIVRGVELDDIGMPVAFWIYPYHPNDLTSWRREPVRIEAQNVRHLFRKDRIGQTRGTSWYAPVIAWMRDLGLFVDNEMQAGAVGSCFAAAITSESPIGGLIPPTTAETTDTNGNTYDYLEPGIVMRLRPGESIQQVNPSRPNSGAEPWINLMLRGIAVGTGLSYEILSRDFSQTNYSSNRASQLEDRRRFRRWQRYMIENLLQPVWDRFALMAAIDGNPYFANVGEIEADVRRFAPAEFMPPTWEWVDPVAEQASSQNAINAFQATYSDELGAKGQNWRRVFKQRAKEEQALKKLGLLSATQLQASEAVANIQTGNPEIAQQNATGELMGLSTLQFNRNRKAIDKVLQDFASGAISEAKARVFLSGIGMAEASIQSLLDDARDGKVESLPEETTEGATE